VRVSAVASIVRVDDPGTADVLVGDPSLAVLRLRRLSPTVLASRRSTQSVIDILRDAGHPAVAEGGEGELLIKARQDLRAPAYRSGRRSLAGEPLSAATLDAYVRALRVGERARESRPDGGTRDQRSIPGYRPVDLLPLLTEAARAAATVWIGYVDNNGSASERLIDPLRVEGGRLTAYDHVRDAVRTFAIHRITGLAPAADSST
jgi:predicted DNA-binding transcriptional regulator YafY